MYQKERTNYSDWGNNRIRNTHDVAFTTSEKDVSNV